MWPFFARFGEISVSAIFVWEILVAAGKVIDVVCCCGRGRSKRGKKKWNSRNHSIICGWKKRADPWHAMGKMYSLPIIWLTMWKWPWGVVGRVAADSNAVCCGNKWGWNHQNQKGNLFSAKIISIFRIPCVKSKS